MASNAEDQRTGGKSAFTLEKMITLMTLAVVDQRAKKEPRRSGALESIRLLSGAWIYCGVTFVALGPLVPCSTS